MDDDSYGMVRGVIAAGVLACALLFAVGFVAPMIPFLSMAVTPANVTNASATPTVGETPLLPTDTAMPTVPAMTLAATPAPPTPPTPAPTPTATATTPGPNRTTELPTTVRTIAPTTSWTQAPAAPLVTVVPAREVTSVPETARPGTPATTPAVDAQRTPGTPASTPAISSPQTTRPTRSPTPSPDATGLPPRDRPIATIPPTVATDAGTVPPATTPGTDSDPTVVPTHSPATVDVPPARDTSSGPPGEPREAPTSREDGPRDDGDD